MEVPIRNDHNGYFGFFNQPFQGATTMFARSLLRCAVALAVATPVYAIADSLNVMQARAGKPSTHVTKSCITKIDLDQDRVIRSDGEGRCKRKIISKSATKIVYEQTCAAPRASTSNMVIETKTPESIVAGMDIVQGGANGKVHVDIKGRWLGASCAGIKEGS